LEAASITVAIDVTSVKTDAGVQDHLLREDFFDAEQFPEATFTSTSIESLGGDRYEITGELTIKGATETVTLNATITDLYMLVNYDLPRQTFGVGNDSYGDKLLETLVPVEAKLVFVEVE
jgi:polyisoprenoid-binding protein YceI